MWTSAVAEALSQTTVLGVDITPPTDIFKLNNLKLLRGDIEAPWTFLDGHPEHYDVITLRVLVSAIHDWPSLIRRCFEHLKPGGWIEVPDVTIGTFSDVYDWRDEHSPLMRWYQCYRKGASAHGIDGFANENRATCLADQGFTTISENFFRCYLDEDAVDDPRDQQIARFTRENVLGLLNAVTKTMQNRDQWALLNITSEELEQLREDAREDICQNAVARRYHWV